MKERNTKSEIKWKGNPEGEGQIVSRIRLRQGDTNGGGRGDVGGTPGHRAEDGSPSGTEAGQHPRKDADGAVQNRDDTPEDEQALSCPPRVTKSLPSCETEFDHENAERPLEGGGKKGLHIG